MVQAIIGYSRFTNLVTFNGSVNLRNGTYSFKMDNHTIEMSSGGLRPMVVMLGVAMRVARG